MPIQQKVSIILYIIWITYIAIHFYLKFKAANSEIERLNKLYDRN
jgi:hypothetical protein